MNDTSFIDLLKEENLSKIKIDQRLIPTFIESIKYFQEYFNYMGYTNSRNYKEFFDKYLISRYSYSNLSIVCNKKPSRSDCKGYYSYSKNEIIIDESLLNSKVETLDTFVHEFIHFLVGRHIKNVNEDNITTNTFIDEGLTEMLKMQILPLTDMSYVPQIKLIKYFLILKDKQVNFNDFLQGKFYDIDNNLEEKMADYLSSIDTSEHIYDARENVHYVDIQRYMIKSLEIDIESIEDYELLVNKLSKRPVEDIYFMNKYYKKIDNYLSDKFNMDDNNIRNRFLMYLKELRNIIEKLNSDKVKYKYTFKYGGEKYQIDNRRNVFIDEIFEKKVKLLKIDDLTEEVMVNLFDSNIYEKNLVLRSGQHLRFKKKIIENNNIKEELIKKKVRLESILKYIKLINDSNIITNNCEINKTSNEKHYEKIKKS